MIPTLVVLTIITQDGGALSQAVKGAQTVDVTSCARKVELCFSPGECDAVLVKQISTAKKIDLAIYSLTRVSLVDALRKAKLRGAAIRIYVDNEQAAGPTMATALRVLRTAGIPVRLDNSGGLMHMKVAAIDGTTIAYGSFNWTTNAVAKNDEILTVWKCPTMVAAFTAQFEKLWPGGVDVPTEVTQGTGRDGGVWMLEDGGRL